MSKSKKRILTFFFIILSKLKKEIHHRIERRMNYSPLVSLKLGKLFVRARAACDFQYIKSNSLA
jgi:hypothetical protein